MMFKPMLTAAAAVAVLASAAGAQTVGVQTPGVSLVIRDGLVTLKAEQASLRQILAEWERLGQVRFVGADKLTGGPVTISLTGIPEKQALEIVMRGVPGYMAVDRTPTATMAASASRFDRVVVMARAATPVPAASMAGGRMPSPAQPMTPTPENFLQPTAPDDDTATAQPERNDVEQFANTANGEPPMPEAPVASPYPNAYPGSPYVGAQPGNQQVGPYGGNPTAAAAAAGTNAAPETQFDYANPQKYFEQLRLQQEAAAAAPTPTPFPTSGTGAGATGRTPQPTGMPTAPGTLARPGIAPVPQATPQPQGEFFNPYNLPADWVPPPPVTNDTGTPVEPDRAKYTNPYEQPKPPEE
jgi:hypothetical protein